MNLSFYIQRHQAKAVLEAALAVALRIHCDELDCSKSFRRVKTSKTAQEIIAIALETQDSMFFFIGRPPLGNEPAYFDIGLRTSGNDGNEYFIFAAVEPLQAFNLARDFKLNQIV